MRNIKLVLLSIALIIAAFSIWLLPTFIYNELEFQFRREFVDAYYDLEQVNQMIPLRQILINPRESKASEDKFEQVGEAIESGISTALVSLHNAEATRTLQDWIPFLPGDYREYHNKKKKVLESYLQLTKDFQRKKQNDHMLTNTMLKISKVQQMLARTTNDTVEETIEALPENAKSIEVQAQVLYQQRFITKNLYDHFINQSENIMRIYDQSQKAKAVGLWNTPNLEASFQAFARTSEKENPTLIAETWEIGDALVKKYNKDYDRTFAMLNNILAFYNKKNLADDKLSIFLSKYNAQYPRNDTKKKNPLRTPTDKNPDLLSFMK